MKDAALPTALELSNIMSGMVAQGNREIFWLDARPVIVTAFHATFVDARDIEEAQGDFFVDEVHVLSHCERGRVAAMNHV